MALLLSQARVCLPTAAAASRAVFSSTFAAVSRFIRHNSTAAFASAMSNTQQRHNSASSNSSNHNNDSPYRVLSASHVAAIDQAFTGTADLYDRYLDQARVVAFAGGANGSSCWKHYGGLTKFWGQAFTIKCFEDNSRLKEWANDAAPTPQSLLVVDAGASTRCAVMGDLVAQAAYENGWNGVVIHGCVRDTRVLRQMNDFGILALGSTPRKSVRRGEGSVRLSIQMGHERVWVHPGDLVFCDEDGILVVDHETVIGNDIDNKDHGN